MALQGTLKDFGLAEILQLIGLQRKTGVLTLKRKDETVTVSFLEGSVVAADSSRHRLEDRLGTVLVKSSQLSEKQLGKALRVQKQTLKRLGVVLVEQQLISSEALSEALQAQVSQIVYRLFRWRDGEYHFNLEENLDYDQEHVVPLTAESLLMEGARILDEWPMIEKKLGPPTSRYQRIQEPSDSAGSEPDGASSVLNHIEQRVLAALTHAQPVSELVEDSPFPEFETCKALCDLMDGGMVERVDRAKESRPGSPRAEKRRGKARSHHRVGLSMVLSVWVLFSLATAFLNPLNGLAVLRGRDPVSRSYLQQVSRTRLERLNYAVEVFILQKRGYPRDLEDLVVEGLVNLEDLRDPWGHPYRYQIEPDGYLLQGFTAGGGEDPVLSVRSTSRL